MNKSSKKLKIIFMGTPDFAVPALTALSTNNYNVVLVVTQPDRPKGRGRRLAPPPVKETALKSGYDIIQPVSIKTREFADTIRKYNPDLFIVVAYGKIIPREILEIPKTGALNIHASLLPKYRGAAPIQWAVINNEEETGVTVMMIDEGLDTGDILFSSKMKIEPWDTSATLHDRLASLGADLIIKTLENIETSILNRVPQDNAKATYAPLLKKSDGHIDWKKSAEMIEAFIRGMTPWPGAFTFHESKRIKIYRAEPIQSDAEEVPGTVLKSFPDELRIATGNGVLLIQEIQGTSGKRLLIKDFIRGYKIKPGAVLS